MRVCAAIRTNKWGEDEARAWNMLAQVFGPNLEVVYHGKPEGALPCAPVLIDDAWALSQNLAIVPDWGWRCGDYPYYALRQAKPDYDYYWLIEPDVHFTASPHDFFARFEAVEADALGYQVSSFDAAHPFAQALDIPPMRAIFALTRLSGKAIDRLFALRQQFGKLGVRPRKFTNDELFVFSNVEADDELHTQSLEALAPEWFDGAQFDTNPDLLLDVVNAQYEGQSKVLHPVRAKQSFKAAVAARLSGNTNFLGKMGSALDALSNDDLDDIAGLASQRLLASLKDNKSRAAR